MNDAKSIPAQPGSVVLKGRREKVEPGDSRTSQALRRVLGPKYDSKGAAQRRTLVLVQEGSRRSQQMGYGKDYYYIGEVGSVERIKLETTMVGGRMEMATELLKAATGACREAVAELQEVINENRATFEALAPELTSLVEKVRSARMTVSMELKQSLGIMKDVRKFFLESEYRQEMDRMKEFLEVAERLNVLIQNGTMDAITDVAIKLAIKEDSNEH